jgi:hypothetical protein
MAVFRQVRDRVRPRGQAVISRLARVRTRTWLVWASLLFITLCAISILRSQSMIADGRRVWWLGDDMMISMSYARSLARGDGLVWYPGAPRVEGYSNLGWTLLMAAVHLLPLPSSLTSLPIMALNVVLGVVVLALTARLSRVLAPDAVFAAPATLLALAISADLGMWAVNGWEFTLQTALFIWLVLRVLSEARTGQPRPLTFLLAGVLGIIRVDGILWSMSVVVLALILNRQRRKVLLWSLLAFLFPLAQVLFRLRYYGFPLPNTYYLKLTGWGLVDRVHPAMIAFYHFLRYYGLILLAATWGAWISRDRAARALWFLGLPCFLYTFYAGGDAFGGMRYFLPWLPILFALAFLAPHWAGWRMPARRYLLSLAVLIISVGVLAPFRFWTPDPFTTNLVRSGLFLRETAAPEDTIAVFAAGIVPYYSELRAVDLLGKSDPVIAHQPIQPHLIESGHNKFDFDYSLGQQQPDLVMPLAYPNKQSDRAEIERKAQDDWYSWLYAIYLNDVFSTQYAGSMVLMGNLAVFVRADSPAQSRLMHGACSQVTQANLSDLGLRRLCRVFD